MISASSFPEALVSSSPWLQQKSWLQIYLLILPISLLIVHYRVKPKCTWSRNDVGSSRSTSFIRIFQVGYMFFLVLRAILISSTYTDRNSPLARLANTHSQSKTFPNRVPIELSHIAFPTIVLPEDDRSNSFQEERLDLPYRTMIWAICAFVDVSKYVDILTLEFFQHNAEASSHLTCVQADTASAA